MKSNKLFNVAGSKERLFEMMQKVNKVALHEGDNSNDVFTYLDSAWGDLASHRLKIDETNTQAEGNESYVEIIATDQAGTQMRFSFKITAEQDEQDGVWNIINAELFQFTVGRGDEHGISVDSDSQAVKNFNARRQQSAIIDVVSEYADFESGEPEAELDEEYVEIAKKIDSYPFGGTPRTMVTSQQYGDEKPTNPALRVKAPELNKFVDEEVVTDTDAQNTIQNTKYDLGKDDVGQKTYNALPNPRKVSVIKQAMTFVDGQLSKKGIKPQDMSPVNYKSLVKQVAALMYTRHLEQMNEEGMSLTNMMEGKKKKKDGGYPDQIGSHFKPKSDYPVEKKKPSKVVAIDEEETLPEPMKGVRSPAGSKLYLAKAAANADMKPHFNKRFGNTDVTDKHTGEEIPSEKWNTEMIPDDTQFDIDFSDSSQRGMNNPNMGKYFDIKQQQMYEGIEKIEQDYEETGEKLKGGLGDDKSPQEFDQEQVLMGLKVEMEHSDDPTVALEIVLDHLTEDPEYYTTKEDPEASAQANAAEEAGEDTPHASGAYVQDGMAGELDRNGHPIPAIEPDFRKMGYGIGQNTEIGTSHAMDTTTGGESGPFGEPDNKEEEDILLGFKPHNVGDGIEETYGTPDPLKIPMLPKQ